MLHLDGDLEGLTPRPAGEVDVLDLLIRQADRHLRLTVLELFDIPGGVEQAQVRHPHIFADPFHFLEIPQREGIVIAVGKEHTARFTRTQQVVGIIPGDKIAAAVLGMIVDRQHARRPDQQQQGGDPSNDTAGRIAVAPQRQGDLFQQRRRPDPHPDRKGEKRTDIAVIALPRLGVGLIEVDDDRQAGHQKQHQHGQSVLPVAIKMIEAADQPQQERDQPELAKIHPRAVIGITGKIPQEIAHIHTVYLIAPEKIPRAAVVVAIGRFLPGCGAVEKIQGAAGAILLAIHIFDKFADGFRVVLVDAGIQSGANVDGHIRGIADRDQQHAAEQQRQGVLSLLQRQPQHQDGDGHQHHHAAETEYVDHCGNALDHSGIYHQGQEHAAHGQKRKRHQRKRKAPVIDDHKHGRQGQHIEQMHPQRQPDQIGDQQNIFFISDLLAAFAPMEHQPYHQSGEEHRRGVHLRLDGIEPEAGREGKDQRADGSAEVGDKSQKSVSRFQVSPYQMHDNQVQKEHREGAG